MSEKWIWALMIIPGAIIWLRPRVCPDCGPLPVHCPKCGEQIWPDEATAEGVEDE